MHGGSRAGHIQDLWERVTKTRSHYRRNRQITTEESVILNYTQMTSIINLFEESVTKYHSNIFMWEKKTDKFEGSTYAEIHESVHQLGAGFVKLGINKGDRIALLSEGRNDWLISELAILYTGAINVPLSVKLEVSELQFRLEHSGCRMIIVSKSHLEKVKQIKNNLLELEKVIILDTPEKTDEDEITAEEIYKSGLELLSSDKKAFENRWKSIKENDYANICYTSGTTADPKGIILSHRNYTANVEQAATLMDIPEHYRTLLILPWDHSFAHTAGLYSFMAFGASIASVQTGKTLMETLKNIPQNIKEIKPHMLMSVPALAKNFKKNIESGVKAKGAFTNKLFNNALKLAYSYNKLGWDRGKGLQKLKWPLYRLYDKIIFSKIRANFGGELEFFIGGGALLDIKIQKFFYAIGIPMFQGYGLSESSPIISSNCPKKHKMGSSGFLVKHLDLKICDDDGNELPVGQKGEIIAKGENIMIGYWKNENATNEALKNGWLHTGDMGYMDKDGFLYVLGRFKSLLISNDGEKYSPEGIEEALIQNSLYIEQCMLYNNQNNYTIGVFVPNKEMVKKYLSEHDMDIQSEEGKQAACNLFQSEINIYRKGGEFEGMFPERWLPSALAILEEGFTEENHFMNSTLKMVRGKITEHYKNKIDYLFTPEGKNIGNPQNIEVVSKF